MTNTLKFTSENGAIMCNGKRFMIKGVNWFGFETEVHVVHGLWARKMDDILDWCVTNNFNALRIPFSCEFALNLANKKPLNADGTAAIDYVLNPDLVGLLSSEILDKLVMRAAQRGILILLDMHRLQSSGGISELWYDNIISEEKVIQAWKNIISRYNNWNVFAADIKNEPHGAVTWGDNNIKTDFALWAERCGNILLQANPRLLIFVEGIDKYINTSKNITDYGGWGTNLNWVSERPIRLNDNTKLVYSPHQYGAGVVGKDSRPVDWEARFGFIKTLRGNAVCIGEWGGDKVDYAWQQSFAQWLAQKDITDHFYWCINPNSGDTKGLLADDWKTEVFEKLNFCKIVTPTPSKIIVTNNIPTYGNLPTPTPAPTPTAFTPAAAKNKFLDLYAKLHNTANGYFSPEGIPYHAVETVNIEAPDYGHETTSEAYSYYIWLEALNGRITGNWAPLKAAWDNMEKYIIPELHEQPTNAGYNPAKPASYAPEFESPSQYPAPLDFNIPVGNDPIAAGLHAKHGNAPYGMHWLMDVDNFYGFGGAGTEPTLINTFQRGPQESVWETVPQPSIEEFKYGGPNGFLDLFTKDPSNTYSKQWRYTDAPDADARIIQAIYMAKKWADQHGGSPIVNELVVKAAKMADWLRYSFFDKYFKPIGAQNKNAQGNGYDSCHYLLSWYYAWGGPMVANGWAFRIGCSHTHFGYQNPIAAWILSNNTTFKQNMTLEAANDWTTSLTRQIQLYYWLQSNEGGIAGGVTNSYNGRYEPYPAGLPTFYKMVYDEAPVFLDPPSNRWFGFQAWSMERVLHYYHETKDQKVLSLITKWINWVNTNIKWSETVANIQIPSDLAWTGKPIASFASTGIPPANTTLHVTVTSWSQDIGIMGCVARSFLYFASSTNNAAILKSATLLMECVLSHADNIGYTTTEARGDYARINDKVYVPPGWTGKMPNGDTIDSNSTFLSIRSNYKKDPMFQQLQATLAKGETPVFKYHRFWAQVENSLTFGLYYLLYSNDSTPTPTPTPIPKLNLTITIKNNNNNNLVIMPNETLIIR